MISVRAIPKGFWKLARLSALVVGAFVMYAALVYNSVGNRPAKPPATRAMLGTIQNAIKAFEAEKGRLPQNLVDFQVGGATSYLDSDKALRDSWGREFVYNPVSTGQRRYQLCSKGPDGRFPSSDDIDVWDIQVGQ